MAAIEADIDQRIWQVVAMIPRGRVSTYGDVARFAGLPGAARRVGRALRTLPGATRVPWHRVVNAGGRISLPAGSDGQRLQRSRLEAEGVAFRGDRLDLGTYRWRPGERPPG
jgi:methylated-DNA-protein-cysteine methyltransferase-like protein